MRSAPFALRSMAARVVRPGAVLPAVLALALAALGPHASAAQPTVPAGPVEKGQFLEVNDLRIFYHAKGKGAPLYLLHGGPGIPHDSFHPGIDSLAEAATLVFYDARGTGRSSKAKKPKDYTLDRMADDLEAMRKKLKHERIGLLGHGSGGMLALTYATRHPDRVDRLVLVSTAASAEELNRRLAEVRAALPDSLKRALARIERDGVYGTSGRYRPEYEALCLGTVFPRLWFVDPARASELPRTEVAYDVLREMWGSEGEFAVTGNLAKYDVRKKLSKIRCPTLILVGKDEITTPAMAEVLRKGILDSRVKVFERSRHFPWIEEREAFLRTVRDFLDMPLPAE